MSIIDKVVFYLNDVLVSLDIAPILKTEEKRNTSRHTRTTEKSDI